jgi:hypothetical protein
VTKAQQVFEAMAIARGYKDMRMVKGKYVNPSMQTRWNFFLMGWQLRGTL